MKRTFANKRVFRITSECEIQDVLGASVMFSVDEDSTRFDNISVLDSSGSLIFTINRLDLLIGASNAVIGKHPLPPRVLSTSGEVVVEFINGVLIHAKTYSVLLQATEQEHEAYKLWWRGTADDVYTFMALYFPSSYACEHMSETNEHAYYGHQRDCTTNSYEK